MTALRLRISALVLTLLTAADVSYADTLSFQQGDGGAYSEAAGTHINFDTAVNFGTSPYLMVFAFDPDPVTVAFLRFPFIVGNNAGQIPPNSVVSSATLELTFLTDCSAITTFHPIYAAWDESTVSGVNWSDVEGTSYGPSAASMPANVAGTIDTVDFTPVVQGWVSGAENWGVLLRPVSGTIRDSRYHSDDGPVQNARPKLIVEFTPPLVAVEPTTWGKVKALYR